MNINFKEGVTPDKLKDITFRAIFACAKVFDSINQIPTITSTHEGKHLPNSYHYIGQAFDIRTFRLHTTAIPRICERLTEELHKISTDFQVIQEDTHIHIEFDNRNYQNEKI